MAEGTKIEWTDHTFNPWVGCMKVGPGCDHCYAEAMMDKRLHRVQWGAGQPRKRTSAANWREPLRWQANAQRFQAEHGRRQRVFCASLADVFDNEVPDSWREDLFALIEATPHLDWLLLTKRIGNAANMLPWSACSSAWGNVWIGATVVNQTEADRDIPKLLGTPAAKRFLSMEPLLGPVDLTTHLWGRPKPCHDCPKDADCECGYLRRGFFTTDPKLDLLITGGESGHNPRPSHPDWFRSLRDQCVAAGVAFFFKQWGEWAPDDHFVRMPASDEAIHEWGDGVEITGRSWRYGKKAAGRQLDGREWNEFPA